MTQHNCDKQRCPSLSQHNTESRETEHVAMNIVYQIGDLLSKHVDVDPMHFAEARQKTNDRAIDFAAKLIEEIVAEHRKQAFEHGKAEERATLTRKISEVCRRLGTVHSDMPLIEAELLSHLGGCECGGHKPRTAKENRHFWEGAVDTYCVSRTEAPKEYETEYDRLKAQKNAILDKYPYGLPRDLAALKPQEWEVEAARMAKHLFMFTNKGYSAFSEAVYQYLKRQNSPITSEERCECVCHPEIHLFATTSCEHCNPSVREKKDKS